MLDFSVRGVARAASFVVSALWGCSPDYAAVKVSPAVPDGSMCLSASIVDASDGGCIQNAGKIGLDSVGYLPTRVKMATLVSLNKFEIKRADGSVAFSGDALGPVATDTGEDDVWVADFTSLTEPGEYFLQATGPVGVGVSPHFRIGSDAYDGALATTVLGLHGQRCGVAVQFDFAGFTFKHAACHTRDAYTTYVDGQDTIKPSLGGWHDAGDYGKYVTNGAFALGLLFKAWEHFPAALRGLSLPIAEHGGALPDFLAEMKWQIDWLLTTQFADGSVSHKVTALSFEDFHTAPEADSSKRFYAPVGTAAAAEIAAVLAMAARIYEPYDAPFSAKCLAAANLSYGYLQAQTAQVRPDLSDFTTGGYTLSDSGARLWAAAEIFETTRSSAALLDLENRIRARALSKGMSVVDAEWDWGNPGNLGTYTYLLSAHEDRDPALLQKIKDQNQQHADEFAQASEAHAYGRAGIKYVWGANGTVARVVMNLQIAYRLSGDKRYLDASVRQIDHLFGRNYYARSQVTGIGDKPVLYPHHRPSVAIGRAWPGLLVGGANPGPTDWVDSQDMYEQNEVALNWNAALVYALASFASGTNEGTGFYDGSVDAGLSDVGAPDAMTEPDASLAPDVTLDPDAPPLAPDVLEPDAPDDAVTGD